MFPRRSRWGQRARGHRVLGIGQPGLCLLAVRALYIGSGETQEAWILRCYPAMLYSKSTGLQSDHVCHNSCLKPSMAPMA